MLRKGIDYTGVSVVFLCHDGQGKYLFNKRSQQARDEHGCWDPGGGALEFRETVKHRLFTEVFEEYGAEVVDWKYLGYMNVFREVEQVPTHWVALCFLVQLDPDEVTNNEPDKFDEIGWFGLDSLPSPMHSQWKQFYDKFRRIIE